MGAETVMAVLSMTLNVDCPECQHTFNLFSEPATGNDEGQLYEQVLTDERWKIDASERLECSTHCPECSAEFEVKGLVW